MINNGDKWGEIIWVLDVTGKIVKQIATINNKTVIELSDLENGIYFVKLGAEVKKFIKK